MSKIMNVSVSKCMKMANQGTMNKKKKNYDEQFWFSFSIVFLTTSNVSGVSKNRLSSVNGHQMYFPHNAHDFYNDSLECIKSHSQQEK